MLEPLHTHTVRTRPAFKRVALLLVGVTLALATGVPSHHHERPGAGPSLVDAGHHGHGTKLLDQASRLTSEFSSAALPSNVRLEVYTTATMSFEAPVPTPRAVARGQPPPSDLPRAPPVSV